MFASFHFYGAFIALLFVKLANSKGPRVAPYVDITMDLDLENVIKKTGQKDFTLAFAIASAEGCAPKWGGTIDLNDTKIMERIRMIQSQGGEVIIATGGAMGPYLENACDQKGLVDAYEKILKVTNTNHLDIDIEANVDLAKVTTALKEVKTKRPNTTVSFTLMAQGDDYGLNDALGLNTIKSAVATGLVVDVVNVMAMEYGSSRKSWGDAVIAVADATIKQLQSVYPSFPKEKLYQMLGVTPMIGRNFNGKEFLPEHAKQLVSWAQTKNVGLLAFWSVGRDNGNCAGQGVSPSCSSVAQGLFEFTSIFSGYKPVAKPEVVEAKPSVGPMPGTVLPENNNTTNPPPADATEGTSMEPETSTVVEKNCYSHDVAANQKNAFDAWCKANCELDFCPPEFCRCK